MLDIGAVHLEHAALIERQLDLATPHCSAIQGPRAQSIVAVERVCYVLDAGVAQRKHSVTSRACCLGGSRFSSVGSALVDPCGEAAAGQCPGAPAIPTAGGARARRVGCMSGPDIGARRATAPEASCMSMCATMLLSDFSADCCPQGFAWCGRRERR